MSVQSSYGFSTPVGAPGGIVDLAPHAIDSFVNEENTGVLLPGMGVVNGTTAGKQVKKPVAASTAANFAGVVVNGRTNEYDPEGALNIRKGAAVGVMRYGRIYVRVQTGATIAYGDAAYIITKDDNDELGYFTNVSATYGSGSPAATFTSVAIKGRFLGIIDAGKQIAELELFNQSQS